MENTPKILNLTLNYVFINEVGEIKTAKDMLTPDTFLRLFFSKEDVVLWYKHFPYNKPSVLNIIKRILKIEINNGNLNEALKLQTIGYLVGGLIEDFLESAKFLFSQCEDFYNYNKECQAFKLVIYYLKNKNMILKKKYNFIDMKHIWESF